MGRLCRTRGDGHRGWDLGARPWEAGEDERGAEVEGAESWRRAGCVCVGGWRCLRGRETMRGAGEEHADAWVGHRHHVHVWGPWLVSDDRLLRHKAD